MKILLANHSSYPRIGDTPELQRLRRTIAAHERQEAAAEDLTAAEDALVVAALAEQNQSGLDLVTDGQVRWYDPISHLAGKLSGVHINGLLRFFDTNFYFRQPVARGELARHDGLILSEYEFARQHSDKPVKPVLTGPYTLARHTLAEHAAYKQLERLTQAYTEPLSREVEVLAGAGAEFIQVDEPAILKRPADFPVLERALGSLAKHKGKAKLVLSVYFGDLLPLYDRLQRLPVDVLGLDFTYSPKLLDHVEAQGSARELALGLIGARNTRLEDAATVARSVERLLPHLKGDTTYLTPSAGLEYLPRDRARAKLQLLATVREQIKGAA